MWVALIFAKAAMFSSDKMIVIGLVTLVVVYAAVCAYGFVAA